MRRHGFVRQSAFDDALADFKKRQAEIQEEREKASRNHDEAEVDRLDQESEFITRERESAEGVGGKARRLYSDTKKLRDTVRNGVTRALRRISQMDEPLGRHLRNSLKLYDLFSYEPEDPVPWSF